jgi:hypothetical protein
MNPQKLNFHARINFAATHTTASLPCDELKARTRKGVTRAGLSVSGWRVWRLGGENSVNVWVKGRVPTRSSPTTDRHDHATLAD